MHRHLTTGDVARMTSVSTRTVCKWMELGLLRGHRIPGSMHRRFTAEAVAAFLKSNGIPSGLGKETK